MATTFAGFDMTPGNEPDQKYTNNIPHWLRKGDLILFDLGYFRLSVLLEIAQKGAFFLSRYLHGTGLSLKHGDSWKRLDLLSLLKKHKNFDVFQLDVYLGFNHRIPSRLIAAQLPSKQRNEKIRKARKKARLEGRTLSRAECLIASWNIYVTNISSDIFSAKEVPQIYRIRWSVELLFKQFKSTMNLHSWNHGNAFRLQCEILGTLIVAAIIMTLHGLSQFLLSQQGLREMSFEKLFKLSKNHAYTFFHSLSSSFAHLQPFFRNFLLLVTRSCFKESRISRPSSLQRIIDLHNCSRFTPSFHSNNLES